MKRHLNISIISIFVIGLSVFAACKSKPKPVTNKTPCGDPNVTYAADIKPILDLNCATTCHSAKKHAHGIDLSTYDMVKTAAAEASFMGSIKHEGNYDPMPKNHDKLDEATIQKINCWVENGMKP